MLHPAWPQGLLEAPLPLQPQGLSSSPIAGGEAEGAGGFYESFQTTRPWPWCHSGEFLGFFNLHT